MDGPEMISPSRVAEQVARVGQSAFRKGRNVVGVGERVVVLALRGMIAQRPTV